MSALYGRMQGERAEVTRTAHHEIESKLETWEGAIKTVLDRDGGFEVYIGSKSNPNVLIASGNVSRDLRYALTADGQPIVDIETVL